MIITILIIYLLSLITSWIYVRKQHSKGGKNYGSDPSFGDFFITFCPLLNSIDAIIYLFSLINLNKFYNIKK